MWINGLEWLKTDRRKVENENTITLQFRRFCKVQWKTTALKGRVMVLVAGRNGIYVFLLQKRFLA